MTQAEFRPIHSVDVQLQAGSVLHANPARIRSLRNALLAALTLCVSSAMLMAQVGDGRIRGRVEDQQQRVVAQAVVSLTSELTGTNFTVKTTSTGDYTVPEVPLGRYTLRVTMPGFQAFEQNGILVAANQQLTLPIELKVGSEATTVTDGYDPECHRSEEYPRPASLWTRCAPVIGAYAGRDSGRTYVQLQCAELYAARHARLHGEWWTRKHGELSA
jgi:hypothetical protein